MMSSITKSIQNEYVLLMENAFSEKYKYAFRNLELKELRRFILKELISSPELDNQLTNLIVLLNKFWDTHAAALITEVRASKSYRLLLPIQRFGYNISNHLRSLGIYFDSIIMVDPLHFPSLSSLHSFLSLPPDNSYVRMRRLVLLEHVSNLFRAIPFMTIDDDYPIFLIVPELLDFDKERNHEQSAAFLSQLFFKDRKMDYATYLAFLEHFGRNEETFQKILTNKELLKTLLNNFNNIEKEVWVYDTDLKSFTTREVDLLDYDLPSAIATLLGKVEGAIYAQRSTQLSATLLGIDPVIYSNHMFLHEWTTEQLVKDYGKLNPLSSEEQAITMGLSAAEVKFLTALSDLELKKIRERGQLESLRHELRISRHDLQGKTPDQMQDAADNFSKHLINVVEEYGKSHESAIKNSKKKKISSGVIFAGTATLGIASLAMPQLTLLSAAATGIGLAFGGKSLADIFSEHKAHKNEIQMLEKTPVSLLYGAYKKK
ncbi:hypothetical protein DP821_09480 [Salmonella enterica subsp. enterica serovar Stanley]|uniref:Coiled-coil protein n=4 Tax=Salmonella enterica TaxID=28901 RepID=A0A5V0U750_SALER|nr:MULTISPECIES: coiled-coil protein [Salmonella]EAY2301454.1 hypothetical protein [Salmonella enterica subsp. enterica serovar Typhimurium]EBH8118532.1 hypothetical protein [Salmonella enterica subsp. enterica serovar Paratyphi B str. SPB7]ECE0475626.1 hypothetical protein [Salmonella enterica subsp. enterica serovar Paratyphi A]ECE7565501.1 hypothetical protein [Salmonella enterica subsp. enterica serovar Kinondoni]ECG1371060.1 hypothetical protein [Salmonella enterica subsp. enterica serova